MGFLGRRLFNELRHASNHVDIYLKDVRRIDAVTKRYDTVFHLAALNKIDHGVNASLLFDVNVNGTLAVMKYCRKTGARCILASSSGIYKPAASNLLLSESSLAEPCTLYGVSKVLAENICRYHARSFGVPVVALRIFNMYGPGQKAPFLIPYVIDRLSKNKTVRLKDPWAVRDFISVTDVVRAFVLSSGYDHKGFMALNVGTGYGLSVHEVVKKIARYMRSEVKIKNEAFKGRKRDYVVADLRNISKVLNWRPEISIDKGIALIVRA